MDRNGASRWRFTSHNRRPAADAAPPGERDGRPSVEPATPPRSASYPGRGVDATLSSLAPQPRESAPRSSGTPVEERIKVVIGGRAYILNSTRDRATILAIASEADHLLEHLKITHGNLSEVALSTLAVANVLDQKNEIFALYESEKARADHLEERLEKVYQELSQERYQARSKPKSRAKSKRSRKSASSGAAPGASGKPGSTPNSAAHASAQDLAEDENALEEAQQSLEDYLARLDQDAL